MEVTPLAAGVVVEPVARVHTLIHVAPHQIACHKIFLIRNYCTLTVHKSVLPNSGNFLKKSSGNKGQSTALYLV